MIQKPMIGSNQISYLLTIGIMLWNWDGMMILMIRQIHGMGLLGLFLPRLSGLDASCLLNHTATVF